MRAQTKLQQHTTKIPPPPTAPSQGRDNFPTDGEDRLRSSLIEGHRLPRSEAHPSEIARVISPMERLE
ncbi:hypothetical protein E6O75_ATG02545 [Venturia nashicola]|uniref:Uncharacterized protein n=1 Tax=Venturia nashicola TaxID=86259 RepID=A0A4Z1PL20_9PEZI|nr:hypothetical protein E6O75_ATG02545 [Venturia nashicola]